MVQRNVVDAPIVKPVTPDVGEAGAVIVAAPETTVHKPVPTAATLPDSVAVVTLHKL